MAVTIGNVAQVSPRKVRVGWRQRTGSELKHYFVDELPVCGIRVMASKVPLRHAEPKFCQRCLKSLKAAIEAVKIDQAIPK